jgi:GT2 family glycosyltransferase
MPISVVIPSHQSPEYLDLCLKSATENQKNENQIIVVLDGHGEMSHDTLEKYPNVDVVELPESKGESNAHNLGVTLAEHEAILIVNNDNVFPHAWDSRLLEVYDEKKVIAPNQVEPTRSIFRSFHHKDFGTSPNNFDYPEWIRWEDATVCPHKFTLDGQTWPLFMSKKWYMILGGIDETFPYTSVADHDFFMRCEMANLECVRYWGCNFYHFAGAANQSRERQINRELRDSASQQYFAWKWGFLSTFYANHSHIPTGKTVRGIQF